MHPTRKTADSGFSFIELLAYMAIAALLILAAIPQFNAYREKAAITTLRDDLKNAAATMEAAYEPGNGYPAARPAFTTSSGNSITDPTADPYGLGAVLALLRVNTGQPVSFIKDNGSEDAVTDAVFYYGDKGAALFTQAEVRRTGAAPSSYSLDQIRQAPMFWAPSYPYAVQGLDYGSVNRIKLVGSDAWTTYRWDAVRAPWSSAPGVNTLGTEGYCLNGASTRAPGVTIGWDSRRGIIDAPCPE